MDMLLTAEKEPCKIAKELMTQHEGGPFLLSDWKQAVFIHFEVDRELLQKEIPFPLDLYKGKAYVSLVAFTIHRLRPAIGGKLMVWLSTPIAKHHYLNVRTYVKSNNEQGIYFIEEWLSSRLSVFIGSRMYGLPYKYGKIDYNNDSHQQSIDGNIKPSRENADFIYKGKFSRSPCFVPLDSDTLGRFLCERYIAFAGKANKRRSFRVWHKPWTGVPIKVDIIKNGMLTNLGEWGKTAALIESFYSPGVTDVWIGKPNVV